MSRSLLLPFFLFFLFTTTAASQDTGIVINGSTTLCIEECDQYTVELVGSINQPPASVFWNTGQTGPIIDFCKFSFGPDTLIATAVFDDTTSYTDTIIIFSNLSNTEIRLFSDAPQICPAGNQAGSSPNQDCEIICAGTRLTYQWEVTEGFAVQTGASVTGATTFDILSDRVEVTWGSPGFGSVSVTFLDACDQLVQRSICVEVIENPIAGFSTGPSAQNDTVFICQGRAIDFLNESDFAESYSWNFGDGNVSTLPNPTHAYEMPGTYTVELSALNTCDCEDRSSLTVVVEEGEVPIVDCVGTVCEGGAGTYEASSPCGTFLWAVSENGTILSGGGPEDDFITVAWESGPEGTVELVVEDCPASNSCTAPYEVIVPVLSEAAAITGPEVVCRAAIESYSITPYEGTSFTWSVSPFGVILSGQGTPDITVEWTSGTLPTDTQWVAVELENCYLGCGGRDTLQVNMRPEIVAFGPIEACEGSSFPYQARSRPGNMPVACNWAAINNSGDTVWTAPAPTDMPTVPWNVDPGLYQLRAWPEQPADYCSAGAAVLVRVIALPPVPSGINGPLQVCPGAVYTYESLAAQPGLNTFWQITDGSTVSERQGDKVNLSFGGSPPYAIRLWQEDVFGCQSADTVITLNPVPAYTLSGPASACLETSSTFTADAPGASAYNWSISPANAGTIISDANTDSITVVWESAGPASVTLDACAQSVSLNFTVHPLPQPQPQQPDALCPGETGLVSTATAYATYSWQNENGAELGSDSTIELSSGFYRLLVTDANGCSSDTAFAIRAYGQPDIYISTPDPNGFCDTVTPMTRLFATGSQAGYDYQWLQDGAPVGTNDDRYTAMDFGGYRVSITDQNGCTALSNQITVQNCAGIILPDPSSCPGDLDLTINGNSSCSERSYNATFSSNLVPGTLEWSFDDPGSGLDNFAFGPSASHTYANAGLYRVLLGGTFTDPATGAQVECAIYRVDTVFAAARFTSDEACAGSPIAFTDLSTFLPEFPISDWAWNFGDPGSGPDNVSDATDPTHTYSSPGDYTVTLTVTSSQGCTSTFSRSVRVLPAPNATFELPMANCEGSPLQFKALAGASTVAVRWDFGDPASGEANTSSSFTAFHQYAAAGTYEVALVSINQFGCRDTFRRDVVIEPNNLSGQISPAAVTLCTGDSVTLSATPGGSAWQWSAGDTTETITVSEAGLYGLTISNDNGCTYSPAPVQIDLTPLPFDTIRAVRLNELGQPVAYVYDTIQACEGEDVILETFDLPDHSYLWSNGQTSHELLFTEERGSLLPTGTYEYTVEVTSDITGCTQEVGPFTVIINELPVVSISADQPGPYCEGQAVTLSVDSPVPGISYEWSNGLTGISITTDQPARYFVTARNASGCEARSNLIEVQPGPDISLVPNGCYGRCRPDTLCLPEIPGVSSYQWFFNGSPLGSPQGTVPELIADQSGTYWLEMTANNGCQLQSDPLDLQLSDGQGNFNGQVFVDVNNNGIIDGPDTTLSNATVVLEQGGSPLGNTPSNPDGNYAFLGLDNGAYTLLLDENSLPAGLRPYQSQVDTSFSGCGITVPINWLLQDLCAGIDTAQVVRSGCDSVLYNGEYYTQDTSLTVTYTTLVGCDSTEQVDIMVSYSQLTALTLEACSGSTADFQGTAIPAGSSQDFIFTNTAGCDSIISVAVAELMPSDSTLSFSACAGDSIGYLGEMIAAGTQQQFMLSNAAGCDSTVTVSVTALSSGDTSLVFSACTGNPVSYQGVDLFPGAQQQFVLSNGAGCDSVIEVSVTELLPSDSTLSLSVCPGETIDIQGTELSPGETQQFVLTNAAGCDSVLTVSVLALQPSDTTLTFSACSGDAIQYQGNTLMPGETQVFTQANAAGCDSVITVSVQELLPTDTVLNFSACAGNTVEYQGTDIPAGEQANFTLSNSAGCDSMVTVVVEALPTSDTTLTFSACSGSSIAYQGNSIAAGTQQAFTLTNAAGCDSLVTVSVSELMPSDSSLSLLICEGDSATYEGTTLFPGDEQEFVLTNTAGCDSTVTVTVNSTGPLSSSLDLTACEGETVIYNGSNLQAGDTASFTLSSSLGCDSVVTVTVTAVEATVDSLLLRVCPGATAIYAGDVLGDGETGTYVFENQSGCDSTVIVTVSAYPQIAASATVTEACPGASDGSLSITASGGVAPLQYQLNGNSPQSSAQFDSLSAGTYPVTVTDAEGCTVFLPVLLTERPPLLISLEQDSMSCDNPVARVEVQVLSGQDAQLAFDWSDGSSGRSAQFAEPGPYELRVINACETVTRAFTVMPPLVDESSLLYLPNAFSPNDDGKNDDYRPYLSSDAEWDSFWLMVFDRWGNMLYESFDPTEGWDGWMRGEPMNTGVYVYYLEATINACGGRQFEISKKGDVTLLR